uniref:Uncharacterized protein n=1 Tax=Myoviridae sp. ctByu2 TaxID=2827668 RepID=A0A8S5S9G7_9CAUD|nr:MAG TPA: hypothetical protein [Myoviridae sp. ctByu2]
MILLGVIFVLLACMTKKKFWRILFWILAILIVFF